MFPIGYRTVLNFRAQLTTNQDYLANRTITCSSGRHLAGYLGPLRDCQNLIHTRCIQISLFSRVYSTRRLQQYSFPPIPSAFSDADKSLLSSSFYAFCKFFSPATTYPPLGMERPLIRLRIITIRCVKSVEA